MRVPHGKRQIIRGVRHHDQVDVVEHKTVSNQRNPLQQNICPQKIQVYLPVCVAIQDKTPSIPTLGDMVCDLGGDYPGKTGHPKKLSGCSGPQN